MNKPCFSMSVLGAILFSTILSAAEPKPFILAEDGLAKAVVVIPKDAPGGVRYAAKELAAYLGRISDAQFMVADAPVRGYKSILVGTPYKAQHIDEVCVRVKDRNTLEVTGDRSRGTLYAAYDLLETFGVIFCARDFDYVPRTNRLEIAGDYAKVDWPCMIWRDSWSDAGWGDFRFASKLRFHSSQMRARRAGYPDLGVDYEHDNNHAVPPRYLPAKTYGKDHPEWYAYVRAKDKRNFNWVCISNEEMWAELLKQIGDYLEKHPGARELSVAIGDCAEFCECDGCLEKVRQYPDPDGSEVPSVQCYLLANRIAKTFGPKYPASETSRK